MADKWRWRVAAGVLLELATFRDPDTPYSLVQCADPQHDARGCWGIF